MVSGYWWAARAARIIWDWQLTKSWLAASRQQNERCTQLAKRGLAYQDNVASYQLYGWAITVWFFHLWFLFLFYRAEFIQSVHILLGPPISDCHIIGFSLILQRASIVPPSLPHPFLLFIKDSGLCVQSSHCFFHRICFVTSKCCPPFATA